MNTNHCDTEFRWVKHDIEVLGRPNPVLQTRTVTHGFSELDGSYSHATPWRDVPVLSEAQAAKLDAPPATTTPEDAEMRNAWMIVGGCFLIGMAILIVANAFQ